MKWTNFYYSFNHRLLCSLGGGGSTAATNDHRKRKYHITQYHNNVELVPLFQLLLRNL